MVIEGSTLAAMYPLAEVDKQKKKKRKKKDKKIEPGVDVENKVPFLESRQSVTSMALAEEERLKMYRDKFFEMASSCKSVIAVAWFFFSFCRRI